MTLWQADEVGDTESSKEQLLQLFSDYDESDIRIHAPKPVDLIKRIVEIDTNECGIGLDSFAGTGTTGHAVLKANSQDGGQRRFILIEMEDSLTDLPLSASAESSVGIIRGQAPDGVAARGAHYRPENRTGCLPVPPRIATLHRSIPTAHPRGCSPRCPMPLTDSRSYRRGARVRDNHLRLNHGAKTCVNERWILGAVQSHGGSSCSTRLISDGSP